MARKLMVCHVKKYDIGHTQLKQQYEKLQIDTTFASPSRFAVDKKKRETKTTKAISKLHVLPWKQKTQYFQLRSKLLK